MATIVATEDQNRKVGCSVKVMRSFDYCHFEVCLSTDQIDSPGDADLMRKEAARLVDKAVRQYQIAKSTNWQKVNRLDQRQKLSEEVATILTIADSDRTPEQKAKVKLLEDHLYWERNDFYDYQDDWDDYDNGEY